MSNTRSQPGGPRVGFNKLPVPASKPQGSKGLWRRGIKIPLRWFTSDICIGAEMKKISGLTLQIKDMYVYILCRLDAEGLVQAVLRRSLTHWQPYCSQPSRIPGHDAWCMTAHVQRPVTVHLDVYHRFVTRFFPVNLCLPVDAWINASTFNVAVSSAPEI